MTHDHSSFPTSVLGLLEKKKEEYDEQFCVGGGLAAKTLFQISGTSQADFDSKGFYQCGYYCMPIQSNQPETDTQKNNWHFHLDCFRDTILQN